MWHKPGQIQLLGYYFQNRYYFDVCLSMGSASLAYCCQRSTNIVTYLLFKQHGNEEVNYLDDLGGADDADKADDAFQCLGWIMEQIGIRESKNSPVTG